MRFLCYRGQQYNGEYNIDFWTKHMVRSSTVYSVQTTHVTRQLYAVQFTHVTGQLYAV